MAKVLNVNYHARPDEILDISQNIISRDFNLGIISGEEKSLLEKYRIKLMSMSSPQNVLNTIGSLLQIRHYFLNCSFTEATDDDFETAMSLITYAKRHSDNPKLDGKPYARNTIVKYKTRLAQFFRWLDSRNLSKVSLKTISSINPGKYDTVTKTEDDVLTAEEVDAIINAAKTPMYKALLSLLYETGARSIEMANLKWSDVKFQEWGAQIQITDTKTDKMRAVPCVIYKKYLYDWANNYPGGDPTGDKFVFISREGNPIRYDTVRIALGRFVEIAGVKRKVTLHRFRHSRITHMLREGMSETVAKKAFWGNLDSHMIATYGHLTNKDVENECLKMAGVEIPKQELDQAPKPLTCPQCHTIYPPGTLFCSVCGHALTEKAESIKEQDTEKLIKMLESFSPEQKIMVLDFLNKIVHHEA